MAPTRKHSKQRKRSSGVKKRKSSKRSPAFKDANQVMRPEKKWVDVPGTLAPPIGSAFVVTPLHLNPTSGGTGASNARIGSKINMTSLDVKFNIIWPGNQAVASPSQVRTVIVYDKQANAAAPSRGDVFADGTLWNSPRNLFNQDRFIILADEISDQIESTDNLQSHNTSSERWRLTPFGQQMAQAIQIVDQLLCGNHATWIGTVLHQQHYLTVKFTREFDL